MEKTECYKCGADIEVPEEVVHPLCDTCEQEFEAWLVGALKGGR